MKRLLSRACLIGCVLCSSLSQGFFIVNSSDSPKTVEVVAFLPLSNNMIDAPQVILKKELSIDEVIEAPFALREVMLDIHWGKDKTIMAKYKDWKPLEMKSEDAATWQILGTMLCGPKRRPCHAVIPPTWQLTEDTSGLTVTTDEGKTIHALSRADLIAKIPYRRIADAFPQERILEAESHRVQADWKKIGMNYHKNEEVVIPRTWVIKEENNESVITTNDGKEFHIPIKRITKIDKSTGKERSYTIADEIALKKAAPYRRKDGVIKEIYPVERLFVIEESTQKPVKATQYNIFRRFTTHDAAPAPQSRGVPERIGADHIFEISGTEYETDINFTYTPDEKKSLETRTKRMHSPIIEVDSPKKLKTEKTKQSFRKMFLHKRKTEPVIKSPAQENSTNS
jgi:hypothetical protein